jgi:MFS family permease
VTAEASATAGPTSHWWEAPAVGRAQSRTMRTLSASALIGALGMGTAPTVGVLMAEAIMESETLAGLARTAMTLGAALAGIPLAALAVRRGRRAALGSGWLVSAAGSLILIYAAAASHKAALVLGMLLAGVGTAVALQARFAATDLAEPGRRGRALSLVVWVGTAGIVVGANLGVPGERLEAALGLAPYAGAFIIATVFLFAASAIVVVFLRPDPLRLADELSVRPAVGGRASSSPGFWRGFRRALRLIWQLPAARLPFIAVILANAVMIGVMTMTPVHMHHQGDSIGIVGFTISLHAFGMFAFAPLVGQLADRIGSVPTIFWGFAILVVSLVIAIVLATDTVGNVVALFLLGLGWSFVTVAGSTMLTNAIPATERTLVQGVSDTGMSAVGAAAAGLSGPVFSAFALEGLAIGALVLLLPGLLLVLRALARPTRPTGSETEGDRG